MLEIKLRAVFFFLVVGLIFTVNVNGTNTNGVLEQPNQSENGVTSSVKAVETSKKDNRIPTPVVQSYCPKLIKGVFVTGYIIFLANALLRLNCVVTAEDWRPLDYCN